ncbi:MAG: hypothetical protein [Olavius algarvensis Delta 4 endosymbiont]|nr:MAG: hypothetical protein [Olavius algarvensis Delta 4 endosymbiont]
MVSILENRTETARLFSGPLPFEMLGKIDHRRPLSGRRAICHRYCRNMAGFAAGEA